MSDYTLVIDKAVKVRPSFLALVPGHLINDVINDHLPEFEAALQDYIAETEMMPFRMRADQAGVLFPWVRTVRIGGKPIEFMLCGVGRILDAHTSHWEVYACDPTEPDKDALS